MALIEGRTTWILHLIDAAHVTDKLLDRASQIQTEALGEKIGRISLVLMVAQILVSILANVQQGISPGLQIWDSRRELIAILSSAAGRLWSTW